MYTECSTFRTPPDASRLWRYLNLSEFLWLLQARALYFARVTEFDDKWEGKLSRSFIEGLVPDAVDRRLVETKNTLEESVLLFLRKSFRATQLIYGISCWHLNEVESVAMWKLYTHGQDGVAIQTTVGRLKLCLSHEQRKIFVAEVNYLDHEAQGKVPPNILLPLATKARSFSHESEVRVILERMRGREQAEFFSLLRSDFGETISVDLSTLIEKIVVAPEYPGWAVESLQQQVTAAGLAIKIESSDLLRTPELDELPFGTRGIPDTF